MAAAVEFATPDDVITMAAVMGEREGGSGSWWLATTASISYSLTLTLYAIPLRMPDSFSLQETKVIWL
jgi:hypothetical protein